METTKAERVANYVLSRPPTSTKADDSETQHNIALLEHLSIDFGNLLNQTDISDCFLDVNGTFMAVHKCVLAARSHAFAGMK